MDSPPPIIIGNGVVVTMGSTNRAADGALLVQNGLIAAMGETAALRAAHPRADFLDAGGQYIMPGMICAHTHTYGAFARGLALKDPPPAAFLHILERLWWRLDRALTPQDVYDSALVCLVDAIRHGTTTLIDHHASPNACLGSLDIIATAFREAGLRGCLCYEVSDREGKDKARAGIRENERFIKALTPPDRPSPSQGEGASPAPPPLLSGMMGLHASFTLSDETIEEAVGVARHLGVGCHIHVAEDDADVRDSVEKHGLRTVHRLQHLGVLGPQTIAAHCIHVNSRELRLLAETGTLVVHNPRSNMNNAVGTADVPEMVRRGIMVGLGNDGFGNDMFAEMTAAYLAQKMARADPQALPADDVVRAAVAHNAHIAGVSLGGLHSPVRLGQLAVGAPADVILVDYKPPTPVTAANLPWHLIFGVDGGMVTTTMVAGRLLMHNRQLLTLDEERIFAQARRHAAALWQRF